MSEVVASGNGSSDSVELELEQRQQAAEVAAGTRSADTILRNGRVVDVFMGQIRRVDVAISGTRVALVGDASFAEGSHTEVIDCGGRFILPGFIETHMHVGGSQLGIEQLAEVLLSRGTVVLATDFYEPAYIGGMKAAYELLDHAAETGLDVVLSPTFFPATGNGDYGNVGRSSFEDLEGLLKRDDCVEIREWNYETFEVAGEEMRDFYKAAMRNGQRLAGHIQGRSDEQLQAAAAIGIRSDHEAGTAQDGLDRARAGMLVEMREGSGATDLKEVLRAITEMGADPRHFTFCTDEQELSSLVADGHIDHKMRMAVAEGVSPIDAVRMATLTAAQALGIEDRYGSVAAGRYASLVLVNDLASFEISDIIVQGRRRSAELDRTMPATSYSEYWKESVQVKDRITEDDFRLEAPDGNVSVRVMTVRPGTGATRDITEQVEIADGGLVGDNPGLAKISMFDRFEANGRRTNALIRGLGITNGAFASTIDPGVMNLLVVGDNDTDMAVVADRAVEQRGGLFVASGGKIVAEMPLPLLGLFSEATLGEAIEQSEAIERALEELGAITGALTVAGYCGIAASIPEIKITDMGLIGVTFNTQERLDLVVAGA